VITRGAAGTTAPLGGFFLDVLDGFAVFVFFAVFARMAGLDVLTAFAGRGRRSFLGFSVVRFIGPSAVERRRMRAMVQGAGRIELSGFDLS
jgi:hypothetical protein